MRSVFFENFRCFRKTGDIRIAPVTLLVGENSTGKSSFLAGVKLINGMRPDAPLLDFNEEPYRLGNFRSIAFANGNGKSDASFRLGYVHSISEGMDRQRYFGSSFRLHADFEDGHPELWLASWAAEAGDYSYKVSRDQPTGELDKLRAGNGASFDVAITLGFPTLEGEHAESPITRRSIGLGMARSLFYFLCNFGPEARVINRQAQARERKDDDGIPAEIIERGMLFDGLRRPLFEQNAIAFAPTRTRPERSYDQVAHQSSPDGSHVPQLLARMQARDPQRWRSLTHPLKKFGKASGLFDDISIRLFAGPDEDGPFQVRVKLGGVESNIIDVGHGVSQALPMLVDFILAPPDSAFLVQQPEVHLHPRAQAEFGSLVCSLAKAQDKTFLIETHSDYIIDRVRTELRDNKRLSPEDIQILYFERKSRNSSEVRIHQLELDGMGNILNAPSGYRDFFTQETHRFLGITPA